MCRNGNIEESSPNMKKVICRSVWYFKGLQHSLLVPFCAKCEPKVPHGSRVQQVKTLKPREGHGWGVACKLIFPLLLGVTCHKQLSPGVSHKYITFFFKGRLNMFEPWRICYYNHSTVTVKPKHYCALLFCFVYGVFPMALNTEVLSQVLTLCLPLSGKHSCEGWCIVWKGSHHTFMWSLKSWHHPANY